MELEKIKVEVCDNCRSIMEKTDDPVLTKCPLCGWTHRRSKVSEFFKTKRKNWSKKD